MNLRKILVSAILCSLLFSYAVSAESETKLLSDKALENMIQKIENIRVWLWQSRDAEIEKNETLIDSAQGVSWEYVYRTDHALSVLNNIRKDLPTYQERWTQVKNLSEKVLEVDQDNEEAKLIKNEAEMRCAVINDELDKFYTTIQEQGLKEDLLIKILLAMDENRFSSSIMIDQLQELLNAKDHLNDDLLLDDEIEETLKPQILTEDDVYMEIKKLLERGMPEQQKEEKVSSAEKLQKELDVVTTLQETAAKEKWSEGKLLSELRKLINKDNSVAICLLASYYEKGMYVEKNIKKSENLYIKAASLNNTVAVEKLNKKWGYRIVLIPADLQVSSLASFHSDITMLPVVVLQRSPSVAGSVGRTLGEVATGIFGY